jgi:hypothetical protein
MISRDLPACLACYWPEPESTACDVPPEAHENVMLINAKLLVAWSTTLNGPWHAFFALS